MSQDMQQYHKLGFNAGSTGHAPATFTNGAEQHPFPLLIRALQLVPPVCLHAPFH